LSKFSLKSAAIPRLIATLLILASIPLNSFQAKASLLSEAAQATNVRATTPPVITTNPRDDANIRNDSALVSGNLTVMGTASSVIVSIEFGYSFY